MSRYTHHEVAHWLDDDPLIPALVVDGPRHTFTGLLDADGDKIYRRALPIGFGRDDEW